MQHLILKHLTATPDETPDCNLVRIKCHCRSTTDVRKAIMAILPSGYRPYTPKSAVLGNFEVSDNLNLSEFGRHYVGKAPKYPHYSDPNVRYQSFTDWPKDKGQNPFVLSMAGFFYTGVEDCTRCFHCGLGLKNWLPPDKPFVEHARWSQDCAFLRRRKGNEFVDNVRQNFPREFPHETEADSVPASTTDYSDIVKRVVEMPCGVSIKEMFSQSIAVAAVTKVLSLHDWEESAVTIGELANIAVELQEAQGKGERVLPSTSAAECVEYEKPPSVEKAVNEKTSLLAENHRLKEQMICKVCQSNAVSSVFLPCGHLATCSNCAASVSVCMLCHKKVATAIKVYI
ncbi:baculoviral IAP repeat-containing protein 3-like isoform X2 [Liolophura sinensis]|uniref:baculoviral IAP repeat-containing protein 3-like isoform X2 n=1 Tax=Liolophura sinensis TaxID=3198878 RepID=UPI0031596488